MIGWVIAIGVITSVLISVSACWSLDAVRRWWIRRTIGSGRVTRE